MDLQIFSEKKLIGCLIIFSLLAGCSSVPEIKNLGKSKREVSFYYESGKYQEDVSKVISNAIKDFDQITISDSSAVIFDVDETALSNYEEIKSVDFGYIPALWDKWLLEAKAPAVEDVKYFYHWLQQKGVHTIFITGREEKYYDATYRNLVSAGYTKFDTLIVRSKNDSTSPAGVFKSVERIVLTNMGYKIIGSVGDQLSDFQGEYVGIMVKLPDYLYIVE